jgi:type IV secretory pathway TrbD component
MRALLIGLLLWVAACSGASDEVRPEPRAVWATPQTTHYQVALQNPGTQERRLSNFRIEGEDWGAFSITNAVNPDRIPAQGSVTLDLRVTRRAFLTDAHDGYADYRAGEAALNFEADGAARSVPLHFRPTTTSTRWMAFSFVPAIALGLALLLAIWLRRQVARRTVSGDAPGAPELGDFQQATGYALAMGSLALAFATIPVGRGLCFADLGDSLSAADQALCANGLGGAPLMVAPDSAGAVLWFAGVCAYLAVRFTYGRADTRPETVDAAMAACVVAAGYTATLVSFAAFDPLSLALGQGDGFWLAGVEIARWGAFAQPLALLLSLLALARISSPSHPRAFQLLMAATVVTIFLGSWSVPAQLPLAHLGVVLVGLISFAVKVAGVAVFAAWLRARNERRSRSRPSPRRWQALLIFSMANLAFAIVWIGF